MTKKCFVKEQGQGLVEYALIIPLIAVVTALRACQMVAHGGGGQEYPVVVTAGSSMDMGQLPLTITPTPALVQ